MTIYLYPLWLRLWHWLNALLFLVLIVTGISLHYSASGSLLVSFQSAIASHNVAGVLLTASYLFFVLQSIVTGNIKQYIPRLKSLPSRMIRQIRYYISGIFKGEAHPFPVTKESKFNPLQQLTYAAVMYVLMPLVAVTGWFMLFPETAPDEVWGLGGVWPMATAHTALGFLLSLFMIGHIYLATTGAKVSSNFRAMLSGFHEHDEHFGNTETSHTSPTSALAQDSDNEDPSHTLA